MNGLVKSARSNPTFGKKFEYPEIRCELLKEGNYADAKYSIRYFRSKGDGALVLDNTTLIANEKYPLNNGKFSLYYTSLCSEQQTFDIYIEDNFGQTIQTFCSFYAHLSKAFVNVGDTVSITQQIACVGNTGRTTGSHLHYEIRKGKRFLNPKEWCYCLINLL